MTSAALRIYTAVIALICAAAVAWSIHQSSIAAAWRADSGSWQAVARRSVLHDRLTAGRMQALVARYDRLVVRTRRSEARLLADVRRAQRAGAAPVSLPQQTVYTTAPAGPAPVAAPAPAAPTTSTSPAP